MSKRNAEQLGVMAQLRAAGGAPMALAVGCLLGAFVPAATYWEAHHELTGLASPAGALVAGGLLYSAKTVWQWARRAFACPWKATGFAVLLEGAMVTSHTPGLQLAALGYLVAINAVASGCQLALEQSAGKTSRAARTSKQVPKLRRVA